MQHQHLLDQARHNQQFHDDLVQNFPHNYFDWKITSLFYIAIHLIKAGAAKQDYKIGTSHSEINSNLKSDRRRSPVMPIKQGAYDCYMNLYDASQSARYDGITTPETFQQIKKRDYELALEDLSDLKKYIKGRFEIEV